MSFDLNNSLKNIFGNFKYFSIELDTSTDRRDTSQLVIFVRGITETYQIFEEFVKVIPIMGTVTGTDVFLHLMQLLTELNLPLSKLVGITTDGAPSMVGNKKGTITLLQNEMEKFGIEHNLVKIHCIVHQWRCYQMELLEIQCDSTLKSKYFSEMDILSFYQNFVCVRKYPQLTDNAMKMACIFGSTFLWKQLFSKTGVRKLFGFAAA
ncbi:general transcription factor II-I repeat domain-containing protein 2-like [Octopus sinensis]|uniref:General transcription factor II-I repeat domain-containing protein 2-like n=1 Tax=Octopus sinensis TaxID=2607531 RepID=A0A6P7U4Y2_9MOLL|nr:general transcription factor II-I repeat domain-containing protein 2-like [Octopus sinensis]